MSPLTADTVYTYKVGSDAQGWTAAFSFNAAPASPVFAVLADYGLGNDESEAQLIADGKSGAFDIVIHAGDFAYDFDNLGSKTGNAFMNTLQPFAATHPYMVAPGNHEAFVLLATPEKRSNSARPACGRLCMLSLRPINPPHTSLSHHRYRLRYGTQGGGAFEQFALRYRAVRENAGANSGSPNNFWYSFETPLIHWIAFTAESWTMTPAQLAAQSAWLAADVAKVDRSVTPWVVAFSHKAWQMDSTTWSLFDWMAPAGVDFHFVRASVRACAGAATLCFSSRPHALSRRWGTGISTRATRRSTRATARWSPTTRACPRTTRPTRTPSEKYLAAPAPASAAPNSPFLLILAAGTRRSSSRARPATSRSTRTIARNRGRSIAPATTASAPSARAHHSCLRMRSLPSRRPL